MKPVVLVGVLVLVFFGGVGRVAGQAVGLSLNETASVLWNPANTYEYREPCSQYLRTPPFTYAALRYGVGRVVGGPGLLVEHYPAPQDCVRQAQTDGATDAWVASTFRVPSLSVNVTKNGSVSLASTNLTERMTLGLTGNAAEHRWLLVTHAAVDLGLDGDADDLAVFRYENYSFPGTCAENRTSSAGTYVHYNLSCLAAAGQTIRLNGSDLGAQGHRLVLHDPSDSPEAIYFAPENLTTEWFYEVTPDRRIVLAVKGPDKTAGTTWTAAWTWSDACLLLGDCTCTGWQTTISTLYFLPNGTNQSMSCAPSCADTDGSCTDGSWGGCSVAFQESFSGSAASTLDTGPLEGTATQPAFCGGQSCSVTVTSAVTATRNLSVVRTNTTNSKFHLRCGGALPGSPAASAWSSIYVASPGNPNVTGQMWFDAGDVQTNGTNQSERLEGNKTCFNGSIISDTTITNASLWGNFSHNGSNSTAFRLLDKNQSAGLANSSVTFCLNLTNALDGTNSWMNASWALCANSNTTTGAVTRYGMSCKSLRGPTWITSGTSMSTYNSNEVFNWFNITWPNAGAADPCAPTGAWTVSTTITCTNVNITVDSLNITETGSLTLINTTFRSGNVYVTTGALGTGRLSVENTTFDGSQAWWLNGNLTIGGRVNLSGVKVYVNGSADGSAGINLTNTGALFIRGNASNITAGETTTFGYFFWVDSGSTFSIQDTALYYSGYSGFRYGRGLTINTTAVNFSRVKIYDSSYVGLTILEGANGTNYSALDISRAADATLQLRYVKDLNISQHNSTKSGGGPSLILDGLIIEHANISGNTGDGIGGNGVQNLTLLDVNMTGGTQSGIGLANVKNLTLVSVNITNNAWHGVSGYTLNGVWLHDLNSSGNTQDGLGINYDQLTAQTTSKSNFVRLYNSTVTDAIAFQGSVNLTAWNTTTNAVTYGTCTICNLTADWPIALAVVNGTGNAVDDAVVNLYARQPFPNHTNRTGSGGFVRYVNRTEYARWAATAYAWAGNDTVNLSKHYYANYSQSFNWTGPNETTLTLTYTQCNPVPGTAWNITQNISCANTSISVSGTNITATGSLNAYQVNITTGNYSVETPSDINQVNLYRDQALWVNANFTLDGRYIFSNSTIRMNGTGSGIGKDLGLNLTINADLRLVNYSNISAGDVNTSRYYLLANPGSNLTLHNASLTHLGTSALRYYHSGVIINTSGHNLSDTTFRYYVNALVIGDHANHTQFSNLTFISDTSTDTAAVEIIHAANITLLNTIFFSTNLGGETSFLATGVDGLLINHSTIVTPFTGYSLTDLTNSTLDNIIVHNYSGNALVLTATTKPSHHVLFNNITLNESISSSDASVWVSDSHNITFRHLNTSGRTFKSLHLEDANQTVIEHSTLNGTLRTLDSHNSNTTILLNTTANTSSFDLGGGLSASVRSDLLYQWPVSVYVNDSATNLSLPSANVFLYATTFLTTLTNVTGPSGFVRYLNVTEFYQRNISGTATRQYYANYTVNVSKAGYDNASVSLNISGPNETFVALNPQCTPPNQTHRDWRVDLSDNCDVRHKTVNLGKGNLTFYSETEGEGNATFTNVNLTATRRLKDPSALRSRHNITVQEGKGQRTWTFQTA